MPRRPPLPQRLKQPLLNESAFACVVCQDKADDIHHKDKNNANNDPANLVVLCKFHHNEAHTTRELSQNLTADRLREFKAKWVATVNEKRSQTASAAHQREIHEFPIGVTWGYINHKRVIQLASRKMLEEVDPDILQRCLQRSLVDQRGVLLQPVNWRPRSNYLRNTIYDWFPDGDNQAVHTLYAELTDLLARKFQPIHLTDENWTRTFIRHCIRDGSFIFVQKAHYFKVERQDTENAHIRAYTFKKHIRIEYFIDSKDMFGTTSISVSFSGHKSCSAFLQVKSFERNGKDLIMYCTPIALGVGFAGPSPKDSIQLAPMGSLRCPRCGLSTVKLVRLLGEGSKRRRCPSGS
jgi:hypothetical protein